jgi:hypothetical protein
MTVTVTSGSAASAAESRRMPSERYPSSLLISIFTAVR